MGSWEWVGKSLQRALSNDYRTISCVAAAAAIICRPTDHYGSATDIDADTAILRKCTRVVIHCEKLRHYFTPYAPVEYMDHHVKFAAPLRQEFKSEGYILWAGVRTNLPPLVDWVNKHPLPGELHVLTKMTCLLEVDRRRKHPAAHAAWLALRALL